MMNILKFLFNLYFEIKYRLLYYFTPIKKECTEIQNAYIIQKNTKEFTLLNTSEFIKKIGNEFIINFNNNQNDSLLDIGFKWNKKDYRIQFSLVPNNNIIIFPFFSLDDIKSKTNNQIIMVEDSSDNIEINMERNKLINQYCGPLGDFYKSKNFGISLSNLYSLKYKDFLFRDVRLKLEDIFLNEYEINGDNQDNIFEFKRNLDETKINKYNTNEDYILKTYNKFNLDWKKTIVGVLNWIFCKKKNE
jgi:hypothetical protein